MAKKKKIPGFEYRLTIAPHFNERRQVGTTLITLETAKVFASFRYELSIQEEIREKEVYLKILGLSAPKLNLPASGTARFVGEYDRLKGKRDISVEGLDGTIDTFTLNFAAKNIKLLKSPKKPFTELIIA